MPEQTLVQTHRPGRLMEFDQGLQGLPLIQQLVVTANSIMSLFSPFSMVKS